VEVRGRCDSSAVATYTYDGKNRRVKKDLDSGTDVVYLYDGWRCIEERQDNSGWVACRQYVYGGRYIDEVLLFDKDDDSDGYCHESGTDLRYVYCQDANFNVVAVTDDGGVIVEQVWYEAYGTPRWYYSSQEQTASSVNNPYLFQGRRLDTESGLYYFRNRYYSPTHGRFLQQDPKGYTDSFNLYEAFGSQPLNTVDPTGEFPFSFGVMRAGGMMIDDPERGKRHAVEVALEMWCCHYIPLLKTGDEGASEILFGTLYYDVFESDIRNANLRQGLPGFLQGALEGAGTAAGAEDLPALPVFGTKQIATEIASRLFKEVQEAGISLSDLADDLEQLGVPPGERFIDEGSQSLRNTSRNLTNIGEFGQAGVRVAGVYAAAKTVHDGGMYLANRTAALAAYKATTMMGSVGKYKARKVYYRGEVKYWCPQGGWVTDDPNEARTWSKINSVDRDHNLQYTPWLAPRRED
jgi:RHS repeat-associated protein